MNESQNALPDFSRRIPELDGIRGMAILMIVVYHWFVLEGNVFLAPRWMEAGRFGWSGVDLFFVLSGFLIGGILLDARNSSNYYQVFYIRRFYRILPLYGLLCLASLAVFYLRLSTHGWLFNGKVPWYAYLTFGQNYWMVVNNTLGSRQIDVTWSLAIEEQFYLTLPLMIRLVHKKLLPYLLVAGIVTAPLIRTVIWLGTNPDNRFTETYLLTPCRMDALLLGVLAAWLVRRERSWRWLVNHTRGLQAAAILFGIGYAWMIHKDWNQESFPMSSFGYTWVALFSVTLLLLAITHKKGWVSRLFRTRGLTFLGIIAYCLYLFHEPVLGFVFGVWGSASPGVTGLASLGVTLAACAVLVVLARVSWTSFEKPLVRIGHRYKYCVARSAAGARGCEASLSPGEPALTVPRAGG